LRFLSGVVAEFDMTVKIKFVNKVVENGGIFLYYCQKWIMKKKHIPCFWSRTTPAWPGGWSGYIELRSEAGQKGTLYLENGVIDKCSLEGQFSPYNLFLLLSWEKGTFKAHRR